MSKLALSGALIANAFLRAGYIETWGRGIEKIHRECREHDIPPPVLDYKISGLMLTFRTIHSICLRFGVNGESSDFWVRRSEKRSEKGSEKL
jgi:predicted HTH transcriptional regulator